MVSRRLRQAVEEPGQDAFLDIVANLVGILIILVMVIGARAKDAMTSVAPTPPPDITEQDLDAPRTAAREVQRDLGAVMQKMERQQFEIVYRRDERDRLLQAVAAAEHTLGEQQQLLDAASREELAARAELGQAHQELEDLANQVRTVQNIEAPPGVVPHLPTPLAQTVFGKELHFRLMAGKLVYVPLDELVERFKSEARQKAWKLKDSPRVTDTVGPLRGFRLKYTLKRTTQTVQSQMGAGIQQRVELDNFVLVPVTDNLGETVDRALREDSEFRAILSGHPPNRTTVTVWVYPDSFSQFRVLKESLFQLGFLTASRPLPAGQPISGSPQGTRSAAE